ncbi:MAG: hypothetical protein MUP17_06805 [candidate division Zixibacteria bacterium]|nr:hypothetical protein [candidate division Zixibacteria bacterium]
MSLNLTAILQTLIWSFLFFVIFLFLRRPISHLIDRIKSAKWGSRELILEALEIEETKKTGPPSKELAMYSLGGMIASLILFMFTGDEDKERALSFLEHSIRHAKEAGLVQQVEVLIQIKNDYLVKQRNLTLEDRNHFIDRFVEIRESIKKELEAQKK